MTLTSLLSLPNSSPLREDSLLSGWLLGSLLFYRMQIMSEKTEVSMLLLSLLSLSLVTQSCPGLCNSMDCSLLGSSIHGISQARILEWVAISFSRQSSQPRDWSHIFCLAGRFFTSEPPGKLCSYLMCFLVNSFYSVYYEPSHVIIWNIHVFKLWNTYCFW